ncbi:MAG: hypothetical protein KGJ37_06155 [Verrucomicrobiota bacterium]|nr:hypothetical protein [Verrucomicrobiota bacterium]
MLFALALILLSIAWRIFGALMPGFGNFSPLMALTFCGAVYFRDKRLWLLPFLALSLSDLWLDWHYASALHYNWSLGGAFARTVCFAAGLGMGALVAKRKNWITLFAGALGGSLLFYFATNTQAWFGDAFYPKTFTGWWQAMTIGHPSFPPTLFFFRNTLLSDLLFTGIFAFAMEFAAQRRGEENLLARQTAD